VVLAIDLSGSMNNDGGTPPEPITSVLTSAKSFVTRLRTNDQGGVVTYATNATLVEKLTSDTERLAGVVSKLSIDPKEERGSTNIGDAFKKMREELSSERHSEEARKVAILLTDGLATAPAKDPEIYAETEAKALKDIGVTLFTIGLGAQANDEFLRNIASNNSQYYKAPSIRDLGGIYASITKDICEDGPTVIEIIPKAETSFTPLQ
jgi:Mg-chelatase subunit ChlD